MKRISYIFIAISVIIFLLLSVEIMGTFEPLKMKIYGSLLLFTLIVGSALNVITEHKK